jgi:hypothetical protein
MANPRLSGEIHRRRWYRNPNRHEGQLVYWSVTVVTRALPAEGLKYWAANEVAEYAVSHMQDWSDLPAMEAKQKLAAYPWAQRDAAGLRGSQMHSIMEQRLNGVDFSLEAQVDPNLPALLAFVDEVKPEPDQLEVTIFNEQHGYAGTFDFKGRLGAYPELGLCQVDWKWSKSVHRDYGAQLEAYNHADYWIGNDDAEQEYQPADTLLVVHFSPEGYRIHPVPPEPGYWRAFRAALELRKWEKWTTGLDETLRPPQAIVDPAQERFEAASLASMVADLQGRIKALGPDVALQLSAECVKLQIPTRASLLSEDDAEQLLSLVRTAEQFASA